MLNRRTLLALLGLAPAVKAELPPTHTNIGPVEPVKVSFPTGKWVTVTNHNGITKVTLYGESQYGQAADADLVWRPPEGI